MNESNPNIAIVILDTLRQDTFEKYFDWLEGTTYENAWSTTHYSPAAHGSLFTGNFGSEIGVHGKSPDLDCEQPTLAETLREEGYTTRGFSANTYVSKYFDFDRGFETFQNETRVVSGDSSSFNWPKFIKEHKTDGPKRYIELLKEIQNSEASLLPTLRQGAKIKLEDLGIIKNDKTYEDGAKAIEYVDSTDFASKNEFLFVNLMDAHGPYIAPSDYQTTEPVDVSSAERMMTDGRSEISSQEVRAAYEDCVRYLSEIYAELHEMLTEEFDYVITMADHGEAFGEYGMWGHAGLVPEVTNIPLSIRAPENVRDLTPTKQPVNLHDIFQTVLDLAGVEPPEGTRGASLATDQVDEERIKLLETHGLSSEKLDSLKDDGYDEGTLDKYDQELYAVAAEPGYAFETFDGTIEHVGDEISDAESKMNALANNINRREDTETVDISEDVHERLEELGYA